MVVREKRIGPYTYVYLVETVRERIIRNLGRKEDVERRGDLDRLVRSAARLAQRSIILSPVDEAGVPRLGCMRIGPPLLFERLWRDTECGAVLNELLADRDFAFPVERAVFLTVLHRLMVSGSDRACEQWRDDYRIDGVGELQLHHLYRAMAWLGEELPAAEQTNRTLVPGCVKDLIEERLFARRRDLFTDLSVVFMDTTSLYFEGEGGAELGERGHPKDYRPHLNQMIVGVIVDQHGRPVCSEMWPGNTADVTTLVPVIDRLRGRFAIGHVCVVADRGMISADTIAALEQRGLEYILGVRERSSKGPRGRHGRHGSERSTGDPAARSAGHRAAGQGGQGRRPPLYRLPQPGRGRAGRPDPRGGRGDVTRQTTARRQIARRQQRLSPLPEDAR